MSCNSPVESLVHPNPNKIWELSNLRIVPSKIYSFCTKAINVNNSPTDMLASGNLPPDVTAQNISLLVCMRTQVEKVVRTAPHNILVRCASVYIAQFTLRSLRLGYFELDDGNVLTAEVLALAPQGMYSSQV